MPATVKMTTNGQITLPKMLAKLWAQIFSKLKSVIEWLCCAPC